MANQDEKTALNSGMCEKWNDATKNQNSTFNIWPRHTLPRFRDVLCPSHSEVSATNLAPVFRAFLSFGDYDFSHHPKSEIFPFCAAANDKETPISAAMGCAWMGGISSGGLVRALYLGCLSNRHGQFGVAALDSRGGIPPSIHRAIFKIPLYGHEGPNRPSYPRCKK